ncbi:WD repeat-containing protein wrap73 [Podila epigama]|nr:WD repeat-containing protein wrap73 [Podila epigama]
MDVLRVIELRLFRDVLPSINEMGWSPDSSMVLAACSLTGIVMVWSVDSEEGFKACIQVPGVLTGSSAACLNASTNNSITGRGGVGAGAGAGMAPASPGKVRQSLGNSSINGHHGSHINNNINNNKNHSLNNNNNATQHGFPFHEPGATILRGVRFSADSRHVLVWEEHLLRMTVWSLENRRVCSIQHPKATTQSAVTSFSVPPFSTLGTTATTSTATLSISQTGNNTTTTSISNNNSGQYAYSVRADLQYLAIVERRDCKDYVSIHATEHFWSRPAIHTFPIPELADAEGILWSPDGRYLVLWENPKMNYKLVVYSMEGRCHGVYQVQDTSESVVVPGSAFMGVKSICWHPSSKLFVVGGYDQKIRVLNYMTWTCFMELEHTASINYGAKTVLWRESDIGGTSSSYVPGSVESMEPFSLQGMVQYTVTMFFFARIFV